MGIVFHNLLFQICILFWNCSITLLHCSIGKVLSYGLILFIYIISCLLPKADYHFYIIFIAFITFILRIYSISTLTFSRLWLKYPLTSMNQSVPRSWPGRKEGITVFPRLSYHPLYTSVTAFAWYFSYVFIL